jgi:hypothetical protein
MPGKVPIEELKKLPEFALLPETRQRFLEAYIANGYDGAAAVRACYPKAKVAESIRVMASRALNSPGVVMLLAMHYGEDPETSFCQMVAKMIMRGRISKEQESLIRLLAQVRKFVDPWTPRYEKKIQDGMSNNREAVKRRVQRAAEKQAITKAAETLPKKSLFEDFKNL